MQPIIIIPVIYNKAGKQGRIIMLLLQAAETASDIVGEKVNELGAVAQVLIAVLPLAGIVFVSVLVILALIYDHKRRILLIEKGMQPVPFNFNEKLLLIGIVALCVGAGLTVFFALANGISNALLGGIIPLTSGIGIIIYYAVISKKKK